MVEHIVMWKFKEGREKDAEKFVQELLALNGVIPEIKYMEVKKTLAGEWDYVLISRFDSLESLNTYKNDERHQRVSAFCKNIREARTAADFEI